MSKFLLFVTILCFAFSASAADEIPIPKNDSVVQYNYSETDGWKLWSKTTYTYNENSKTYYQLHQYFYNGEVSSQYRFVYVYNDSYYVISKKKQDYNEEDGWYDVEVTEKTYHADGSVASRVYQELIPVYKTVENKEKQLYSDPKDPSVEFYEEYTWNRLHEKWILQIETRKEFDADGNIVLDLKYDNGEKGEKKQYQYSEEKVVKISEYGHNYQTDEWELENDEIYEYDSVGKLVLHKVVIDEKDFLIREFTYDDTVMTVTGQKYYNDGEVREDYFGTVTYDGNGKVISAVADVDEYYAELPEFTTLSKEELVYNDAGNVIEKYNYKQKTDSEEWELVKKIEMSYYESGIMRDSVTHSLDVESGEMLKTAEYVMDEQGRRESSFYVGYSQTFVSYVNTSFSIALEQPCVIEGWFKELYSQGQAKYTRKDSSMTKNYWDIDSIFAGHYAHMYGIATNERYRWDDENGWVGQWFEFPVIKDSTIEKYSYLWDSNESEWKLSYISSFEVSRNGNSFITISKTEYTDSFYNRTYRHTRTVYDDMIVYTEESWDEESQTWKPSSQTKNYLYQEKPTATTDVNAKYISVYPTTATEYITVDKSNSTVAFHIVNSHGQTVFQSKSPIDKEKVDIANFANGIYFIQTVVEGESVAVPFYKQ